MTELYIDGNRAEMGDKGFAYTLQVNDMFNFETREVGYSETVYLPVTAANRLIFDFAEMSEGDNKGAYKVYRVDYYVNGVLIVGSGNGYLIGVRDDAYIFEFKDSGRELYQYLMNRDIKGVNGLIDGSAERSLDKIVKAHTEDNVGTRELIYLVGNYGDDAEKRDDNGVLQVYRFDNTPLSICLDRVFRLVQQYSGFRFRGATFNTFDWKNAYIASSNIKYNDIVDKEVFKALNWWGFVGELSKYGFKKGIYDNNIYVAHESQGIEPFTIKEEGYYRVSFICDKLYSEQGTVIAQLGIDSTQSWLEEINVSEEGWDKVNYNKTLYFQKGDNIYIQGGIKNRKYGDGVRANGGIFKIEKIKGNDNLSVLVSDFALTDLFKEVFKLFSLTPIRDRQTGVYDFFTLSERVNAPVIDWSSKFVRVKEVKYHSANYGQKNNFLYKKYDEENAYKQRNNDGVIHFDDKVLDDRKDFSSKFFSPLNDKENGMDVMEFFTKEVKKKEDGTTETEYKEKTGRWHVYATKEVKNEVTFSLRAKEEGGGVERYFVPNFEPFRWDNLLNTYYKDLPRVVERMYCVTVEMNLNEIDVMEFSFFSRIYVQQLGSYFMPNKIKYKTEGMTEVEMIKIR
jgi:hypothetical protein